MAYVEYRTTPVERPVAPQQPPHIATTLSEDAAAATVADAAGAAGVAGAAGLNGFRIII